MLLLTLSLISCNKDIKDIEESIIGSWDVTSHKYTKYIDNVKIMEEDYPYEPMAFVLVINADGTGMFLEYGIDGITFTWEHISGNKFSIIYSDSLEQNSDLELAVNGNTLTWNETTIVSGSGIEGKWVNFMVCEKL